MFDGYAREGDSASLKGFAQETIPTLKIHQQMVEKLAAAQSGTAETTTPAVKDPNATSATKAVPGANSFTEDQAKSRIEDAGFTAISKLSKDDQGIWRGEASKDGKSTPVALDYQGNVVAGSN